MKDDAKLKFSRACGARLEYSGWCLNQSARAPQACAWHRGQALMEVEDTILAQGQAFRYVFDIRWAGVLLPIQRIRFLTQLLWRHDSISIPFKFAKY